MLHVILDLLVVIIALVFSIALTLHLVKVSRMIDESSPKQKQCGGCHKSFVKMSKKSKKKCKKQST